MSGSHILVEIPKDPQLLEDLKSFMTEKGISFGTSVIVDDSYDGFRVELATVDKAREMLDNVLENMPAQAVSIAKAGNLSEYISDEYVFKAINKVFSSSPGTEISNVLGVSSQDMIDEITALVIKNKLDLSGGKISSKSALMKLPDLLKLKCFSMSGRFENKTIIESYIYDTASDLDVLFHKKWKDTVSDLAIIRRHMEVAKEFSHRDVSIHIEKL